MKNDPMMPVKIDDLGVIKMKNNSISKFDEKKLQLKAKIIMQPCNSIISIRIGNNFAHKKANIFSMKMQIANPGARI